MSHVRWDIYCSEPLTIQQAFQHKYECVFFQATPKMASSPLVSFYTNPKRVSPTRDEPPVSGQQNGPSGRASLKIAQPLLMALSANPCEQLCIRKRTHLKPAGGGGGETAKIKVGIWFWMSIWLWVETRCPKWNPGGEAGFQELLLPWCFNFDPYPYGHGSKARVPTKIGSKMGGAPKTQPKWEIPKRS